MDNRYFKVVLDYRCLKCPSSGWKTLGSFLRLSWTTWMIGVGCGLVAALIMYLIVDLLISVFMGGSSASA